MLSVFVLLWNYLWVLLYGCIYVIIITMFISTLYFLLLRVKVLPPCYFYCWLLEALLMLQSKWVIALQKYWKLLVIYIYTLFENLFVETKKNYTRNKSWHSILGPFYKSSDCGTVTGADVRKLNYWLAAYSSLFLWYEVRMLVKK
jgi:hypothetical protein